MTAEDGRPVSTLRDYLRVLRRRKWVLVPAVLIAPLVAVLLSLREPIVYQSSAQVFFNRQNLSISLTGINDPSQLDTSRILANQTQLARAPVVAEHALQAAGVSARSVSDLIGESQVLASDKTDFLIFTVTDASPTLAVRLANAYARQYIVYRRQLDTQALEAARKSVHDRIATLRAAGETASPLYASLVEKEDQILGMEALSTSRATLVRPAQGAGRLAPHTVRNGVLALILALVTAIGLAFLADALDPRLRSAEQIGDHLHLRLVGRLPRPSGKLRRAGRLAMLAAPDSPYAEPFRMLRTSLEFVIARLPAGRAESEASERSLRRYVGQPARRVMVTSAVEGEGKSTTAANLAVAFARAGRKVLLVDLDFRRASLHRFFDLPPRPGVMDVVLGSVPLTKAISFVNLDHHVAGTSQHVKEHGSVPEPTLGVLPLGASPLHPSDLALAVGLEEALDQATREADLVLIDGPPLLRVGDAMALTSYVDGLLIVASLRTVRPTMLDELNRVLEDCPPVKLGYVLTGADLESGYEYLTYPYHRALDAS